MSQDMFDRLCSKFGIEYDIEIFTTGYFYQTQGAFYIVFDTNDFTIEEARKVMDKYVDSLEEI